MKTLNKQLVPDYISSIKPYSPGKPIEELERELGIQGSIKLASNENPLGPSDKAVEAVSKVIKNIHRYPDGGCYYLKGALSEFYDISEENLILGNGSNEIIELVVRTFLRPGEEAIIADPTFLVYNMVVQTAGGKVRRVPLKGLSYDLSSMKDCIGDKTRLVFIANPNNPTGTIVKRKELEGFLADMPDDVIIILDEAYFEYVTDKDFPDGTDYIENGRNVIVLRTFSKIYGLAGLRIGYGMGGKLLIENMNRVRQPFNINSPAQAGALAALKDRDHVKRSLENNINGLDYLFKEIEKLGFICMPTQTNFFLIKVGDGARIYKNLLRKGVIVRPMGGYGLNEYIRVTVGLPEENKRFINTFKEVIGNS